MTDEPTPRPMMRCVCCGDIYVRGTYRCCAPPNGMKPYRWLELYCRGNNGCGKCPRHCQCANKCERLQSPAFAGLIRQFIDSPELFGLPPNAAHEPKHVVIAPAPRQRPRIVTA